MTPFHIKYPQFSGHGLRAFSGTKAGLAQSTGGAQEGLGFLPTGFLPHSWEPSLNGCVCYLGAMPFISLSPTTQEEINCVYICPRPSCSNGQVLIFFFPQQSEWSYAKDKLEPNLGHSQTVKGDRLYRMQRRPKVR